MFTKVSFSSLKFCANKIYSDVYELSNPELMKNSLNSSEVMASSKG